MKLAVLALALALSVSVAAAQSVEVAQGCIARENWNPASSKHHANLFTVLDSAGTTHVFAFGPKRLLKIPGGAPPPLLSVKEIGRWQPLRETLEHAAARERRVVVESIAGEVFGVSVDWNMSCR